jgi:hypothetical protein
LPQHAFHIFLILLQTTSGWGAPGKIATPSNQPPFVNPLFINYKSLQLAIIGSRAALGKFFSRLPSWCGTA